METRYRRGISLLPSGVGLARFWVLVDLFTVVAAPTTCSLTNCLLFVRGLHFDRIFFGGGVFTLTVENSPESHKPVEIGD